MVRTVARAVVVALMTIVLSGCGIPADPEGTLDRVTDGTLRVGVSHNPPWTETAASGDPAGAEVRLVEQFAESLGADVEWTELSEARLIAALERGELDLVVAGLVEDTPWTDAAAITRPYTEARDAEGRTQRHVMAARMGENAFLVQLERFLAEREVTP